VVDSGIKRITHDYHDYLAPKLFLYRIKMAGLKTFIICTTETYDGCGLRFSEIWDMDPDLNIGIH